MIYVDMDGVLAKWNTDASVEDTYESGYFLNRDEEKKVTALIKKLRKEGYPVSILSAVYTTGTAKSDKCRWLEKVGLSDVPAIFVPYGEPKNHYVEHSSKNVLLDDFSQNLHKWEDAGYTGVKFYNGINGTHGSWAGYSIDHRMSVEKMFVIVSAIADAQK